MPHPSQHVAVDQEARDLAKDALHHAALSEQAWEHHTKQCEEDRKNTIQTLRDLKAEIGGVRIESQERGRRVHERMEAFQAEVRQEIKGLPDVIKEALKPPVDKKPDDHVVLSAVKNWAYPVAISVLLAFIGYLMFLPNPFVTALGGG